jgi:hypothetical protein
VRSFGGRGIVILVDFFDLFALRWHVLIEPPGACTAPKRELAELGQDGIKQAPRM